MKERRSQRIKIVENFENVFRELSEDEWSDLDEETLGEKENLDAIDEKEKETTEPKNKKQIRLITRNRDDTSRSDASRIQSTGMPLQIKLNVSSQKKRKVEEKIKLPKDMDPEPVCPICLKIIIGDYDDINEHVDECIGPSSSSMNVSGTCTPASIETTVTSVMGAVVNVDEEDFAFGKGQYTELDVENIMNLADKDEQHTSNDQEIKNSLLIQSIMSVDAPSPDFLNLQQALKSLLDRLSASPKCSVCWDTLKMPAALSTNCWHVCCEGCWLRQLGTKRLCPHCSAITNPSDLRKVFF